MEVGCQADLFFCIRRFTVFRSQFQPIRTPKRATFYSSKI